MHGSADMVKKIVRIWAVNTAVVCDCEVTLRENSVLASEFMECSVLSPVSGMFSTDVYITKTIVGFSIKFQYNSSTITMTTF